MLHSHTPKLMGSIFDRLVQPVLNNGCEEWGFHRATNIERVNLLFCKNILKLKRNTPNFFLYGEIGRNPLLVERKRKWLNIC